jgi:hypothetical protein
MSLLVEMPKSPASSPLFPYATIPVIANQRPPSLTEYESLSTGRAPWQHSSPRIDTDLRLVGARAACVGGPPLSLLDIWGHSGALENKYGVTTQPNPRLTSLRIYTSR